VRDTSEQVICKLNNTSHNEYEPPQQDLTQIRPLRGFDRLTNAGLNESEIRVLRSQFHAERGFGHDVENVLDISHGDGSNSGELQDDCESHT
jgi:hypothetical protein